MLHLAQRLHDWAAGSNTTDPGDTMSSTSARDTGQKSSDRSKTIKHQAQRSEAKIDGATQTVHQDDMVQQQPKDRDLHAHSSRSMTVELEAQKNQIQTELTRKYNRIMERSEIEWQDAYARLKRELAIAQDSFQRCQTDLWRLQPLPQVTDTDILNDFDEICHRVSAWIDEEIAVSEKLDSGSNLYDFFQDGGDMVLASFMQNFPNFGEYYIRRTIHLFLCSTVFSSATYLFGLPPSAVALLQMAERTMPNLTPPRDMDSILSWRSETLTAFSQAEDFDELKKEEIANLTKHLFSELLTTFPSLALDSSGRIQRLQHSVVAVAAGLAIKMQVSKTNYRVELQEGGMVSGWKPLVRDYLEDFSCYDIKTRKRVKITSRVVVGREGLLGSMIMPIEPRVQRLSNDGTMKELRTDTFLVALD